MSILLVSKLRLHPNYLESSLPAITIPIVSKYMAIKQAPTALRGSSTQGFLDGTPISITIVLNHTTVYYVALMNYHPSSCIYVTFKHFLVGIVSGVECDIKGQVSIKKFKQGCFFANNFIHLLISTYYHLNRQNDN